MILKCSRIDEIQSILVMTCTRNYVMYLISYFVVFFLSSSCVLCMVMSNTYCVVCFMLFVFVLCLVYGGVQHVLCCVFCFVLCDHALGTM
jgi:hypothetical protein